MDEGLRPGESLAQFRIVRELGRGGMGVVYEAMDARLRRKVALKVLAHEVAADPSRRDRFLREARSAAAVSHPGIATVYEIGESGGRLFIVMELVDGETLRARLASGPLALGPALDVARRVAEALAAAHRAGLVHRDLKPENLMLGSHGTVRLLDFGIAKALAKDSTPGDAATALTQEGQTVGTPGYMAPEQSEGRSVDARTDVFAFGALLYEVLTARPAFGGTSPMARLVSSLRDPVAPPSTVVGGVPASVDRLVLRCLEKDPAARFDDGTQLVEALDAVEGRGGTRPGSDVDAQAATTPLSVSAADASMPAGSTAGAAPARRSFVVLVALGAAAVGAIALVALGSRDPAPPPPAARQTTPASSRAASADSSVGPVFPCEREVDAGHGYRCSGEEVAWCDRDGRHVACCAPGLVAATADGACDCPPGGATVEAAIASGCRRAPEGPTIRPADVQHVVREHVDELRGCYERALAPGSKLAGNVRFTLRLSPTGEPYSVRIESSSLPSREGAACMLEILKHARFPAPTGSEGATITYPLTFASD